MYYYKLPNARWELTAIDDAAVGDLFLIYFFLYNNLDNTVLQTPITTKRHRILLSSFAKNTNFIYVTWKICFFFSFSRHLPRDRQYWETNLAWSDSTSALSTRQCKRELHNVCIFFFYLEARSPECVRSMAAKFIPKQVRGAKHLLHYF